MIYVFGVVLLLCDCIFSSIDIPFCVRSLIRTCERPDKVNFCWKLGVSKGISLIPVGCASRRLECGEPPRQTRGSRRSKEGARGQCSLLRITLQISSDSVESELCGPIEAKLEMSRIPKIKKLFIADSHQFSTLNVGLQPLCRETLKLLIAPGVSDASITPFNDVEGLSPSNLHLIGRSRLPAVPFKIISEAHSS